MFKNVPHGTQFEAGDKYAVTAGHPALVDPKHPAFGIKEGEFLIAEKGGHRVEGFLEIPFTAEEKLTRMLVNSSAGTNALLSLFGSSTVASFAVPAVEAAAPVIPTVMPTEVFEEYEEEESPKPVVKATVKTAMEVATGK